MKKLAILAGFLALLPWRSALADISRDAAIDVVYRLLSPATLDHEAAAYLTLTPLQAGDTIVPFGDPSRGITLTKPVWFAWIDDEPEAFFVHRVRFVLIDVVTGKRSTFVQRWWPEVNGATIFSPTAVQAQPELRIFSTRVAKPVGP